ncbi:MAG: MFS transporter [Pseudomonadota bacterium]
MGARIAENKHTWADTLKAYGKPKMLLMLALGFSAGLPFLLIYGTLSAWLREAGVSRTSIGFLSWIGLAYGFKFLWAPLLDHWRLPWLANRFGRRRAWMLLAQCGIALGLVGMAFSDPSVSVVPIALFAVLTAFCSATQDIAVDAWRIEAAPKSEQGEMAAVYQLGYRFGLIAAGALALYIADFANWTAAYLAMAGLVGVGMAAAILSPLVGEAAPSAPPPPARGAADAIKNAVQIFQAAVVAPFADFISRFGATAIVVLALIATYRIPDFALGIMARPFYIDLGFSLSEIATVSAVYGIWISIVGAFAGGAAVARAGIMPSLLVGVIVSAATNLLYVWLAGKGDAVWALTLAISAENFAGGFAGTALIAYMSMLTNTAFTATQYALFSSFFSIVAKFLSGFSGAIVDGFSTNTADIGGYAPFFLLTAAAGVPAIICVLAIMRLRPDEVKTIANEK